MIRGHKTVPMIYVLYLAPIVVVCIFPRLMVSYFVSFRDCQISFLILFFLLFRPYVTSTSISFDFIDWISSR